MSRDRRGFHYALEPVRSKTGWELDQAISELARINQAQAAQARQLDTLHQGYAQARAAAQAQRVQNAALHIDAQRLAYGYMSQLKQQLVMAQQQLSELEQEQTEAMDQLNRLRRFADNLDRHRDEAGREHDLHLAKQASLQADDAWLQRNYRKKTP
ncbi:hypothetical protein [Chitinimonas sp.]|uniref:hypothetical protein n=1 Tax=Chitinimonas sp. TaxID=1934313 RepID=UPI0035AFD0FB